MKKILITGSSGFVGSNVSRFLQGKNGYDIYTPGRKDVNLFDEDEVKKFLKKERFDVVLHFASPSPLKNPADSFDTLFEDSLRMFTNFYNNRDLFGKMIYTGSGAEFCKDKDISLAKEETVADRIPKDSYGLSKWIQNSMCGQTDNIYNFRIFGCFGPGDYKTKFITHSIRAVLLNRNITIRKDCLFDYIHVDDFARYIEWGINNNPAFRNYNICTGKPVLLSEIAENVIRLMGAEVKAELLSSEKGLEYTGCSERIVNESGMVPAYSLLEGIERQISWERENAKNGIDFDGV